MAVTGIFIDADVGDHDEAGHVILHRFDRALHDAVWVHRRGTAVVFPVRNPEQHHGRNSQPGHLPCFLHQQVGGQSELSGHRGDLTPLVFALHDEHGIDQIRSR